MGLYPTTGTISMTHTDDPTVQGHKRSFKEVGTTLPPLTTQ